MAGSRTGIDGGVTFSWPPGRTVTLGTASDAEGEGGPVVKVNGAAVVALAAAGLVLSACSSTSPAPRRPRPATAAGGRTDRVAHPARNCPRGGREVFPEYRLVGYSGVPRGPAESMGSSPATWMRGAARSENRQTVRVRPADHAGVRVHPGRGSTAIRRADGAYRTRVGKGQVREYLGLPSVRRPAAAQHPARALQFMPDEVLRGVPARTDVGVALDPEWAMDPGECPA